MRKILGYGIAIIILVLMIVGGFVTIIYLLQSDTFGSLKYHLSAGIYFLSIVVGSITFAALLKNDTVEKNNGKENG